MRTDQSTYRLRPGTRRLMLECLHGEKLRCLKKKERLPTYDLVINEALLAYRHHLGNQLRVLGISWADVQQEIDLDRRQPRRTPPTAETSNVIDDDE